MLKAGNMTPGDKIVVRPTICASDGLDTGITPPQWVVLALEPGKFDPAKHRCLRALPGEELTILKGPEKYGYTGRQIQLAQVQARGLPHPFYVQWDVLRTNCNYV